MKRPAGKEEAKKIIGRLEEQAEKTLSTPRAPVEDQDWTERWGRRLGRILGVVLALYLLWHLFTTYVLGP